MDKTEWPTQSKLEELHEAGLFPYSAFATRSFAALLVILVLFGMKESLLELTGALHNLIESGNIMYSDESGPLRHIVQQLGILILAPLAACFVGAFLCGLLQTRFTVRFSRISLDLSRISPFAPGRDRGVLSAFASRIVICFLGLLLSYVALRMSLPSLLLLLNNGTAYFIAWPFTYLKSILGLVVLLLSFAAFLAWLFARFRFMLANRMSRDEVLREHQER